MKYPIEIACIIDDDDMYINLITKVLDIRSLVKNLLIFKNGKEALDYFVSTLKKLEERKIPQVILLDLNMPKINGLEFLAILKSDKSLRHIPTVILTTSNNQKDLLECYKIGVSGYVLKPLKYEDYVAKIESLLNYWSINELIQK